MFYGKLLYNLCENEKMKCHTLLHGETDTKQMEKIR